MEPHAVRGTRDAGERRHLSGPRHDRVEGAVSIRHAGAAAGHSRPAVPEHDAAVLRRPCCSVLRLGAKLKHVCANETVAVHPHVRMGPHGSVFSDHVILSLVQPQLLDWWLPQ